MRSAALDRLRSQVEELVARHEQGRELSEFARYADDPVGFIRDVLHGEPWSRQEEIAESVRDNRLTVVRSANQMGKDWTAARLAMWAVYARGMFVIVTAATERQIRHVVFREIAQAFGRARDLPGSLYSASLRIGDETRILGFTSTEASKLTGFHDPGGVFAVLTEAQGIEPWAWEGVLACTLGAEDKILAVGNPLKPIGRFFEVSRSAAWNAIKLPASDHPNVREGREVIPGAITREGVQVAEQEYGKDSPVYQARVLAEFPDEHVTGLIKRSWLDRAVELWQEGELEREYWRSPYVFAIDSAHTGPDSSCLLQLQGGIVREIETWHGADLMETTGRVAKAAKDLLRDKFEEHRQHVRWRDTFSETDWPRKIVVDVVGLGLGVYSRLKEQGHRAADFNGGKKAFLMASRMANRRAEAYWRVREALQAEELALPPDKKLMEELLAQEWSVTSSGKTILEPKEEIARKLGRSPDRADALSMAVWAQRSFNISRPTGPPLVKRW